MGARGINIIVLIIVGRLKFMFIVFFVVIILLNKRGNVIRK